MVLASASRETVARRPRALVVVARLVLAVGVYLAVLAGLAVLLYVVGLALAGSQGLAFSMIGLAIAEGGALGSVLLVWRFVDRRPIVTMGFARAPAARQWLRGAAVGALMMVAVVLAWFTLVGGAAWTTNPDAGKAAVALLLGFIGFLVQGPGEEVLFRGYILENLRARWGSLWAIGVSSLLFSLLHASNAGYGPLPFVNLLLFGAAMAVYKLRIDGGQLWGVFAIHTVWNWLQQVVFGLPNSGHASPLEDTLFSVAPNTSLADPFWGGGFGPEGTLGTTIVLLALIVTALRVRRAPVDYTRGP